MTCVLTQVACSGKAVACTVVGRDASTSPEPMTARSLRVAFVPSQLVGSLGRSDTLIGLGSAGVGLAVDLSEPLG